MVLNLCDHLARLRSNAGAKVLLLAMENGQPRTDVIKGLMRTGLFDCFSRVLITIHKIRSGEIAGTGSNHCHA